MFQFDVDFAHLFHGREKNLFDNWDSFIEKVIPYLFAENTVKDKYSQTLLKHLKLQISEGKIYNSRLFINNIHVIEFCYSKYF